MVKLVANGGWYEGQGAARQGWETSVDLRWESDWRTGKVDKWIDDSVWFKLLVVVFVVVVVAYGVVVVDDR